MLTTSYNQLDFALADFLTDRCGFNEDEKSRFNAIILMLSSAQSEGHSCIELSESDLALLKSGRLVHNSNLCAEQTEKPLVVEGSRLYFNRYWRYETRLVDNIFIRIRNKINSADFYGDKSTGLLDKYFPLPANFAKTNAAEVDWQREAAKCAAEQSFTIITGGPGTGKTTTVLKILALLQELNNGELAISLAAPTGKAAMRLQQSLIEGKQDLLLNDEHLLEGIPSSVSTLHRLLGTINQSHQFRHDASKPLSCDLLVVDESSMIDLAMMSKLLDALHPTARLILLGDKDQLVSVESGAVLSDLCNNLPKQTVELKKTWRFSGPIKYLAEAVNAQQADEAWSLVSGCIKPDSPDVASKTTISAKAEEAQLHQTQYSLFDLPEDTELKAKKVTADASDDFGVVPETAVQLLDETWMDHVQEKYQPYLKQISQSSDPEAALTAFLNFQVLAAVRLGDYGVEGINRALEKRISTSRLQTQLPWYHGKPIMITRNDPSLGLFNGDIGICLRDDDLPQLRVWFKDSDGDFRAIVPARLPQHETVYAMTIHKSQGSEFNHVMVVLPDKPVPLLSKELLYTAVTRAKQQVDIAANETVFKHTVNQRVVRNSGIQSKIEAVVI